MNYFFSIVFLVCSWMVASCQSQSAPSIPPNEFAEKIKDENSILLDVRSPEEYKENHLKGAVLINYRDADFMQQVSRLDTNKTVYVYCRSGNRSAGAQVDMLAKHFKNVINLEGGINAWQKSGLPVEK